MRKRAMAGTGMLCKVCIHCMCVDGDYSCVIVDCPESGDVVQSHLENKNVFFS